MKGIPREEWRERVTSFLKAGKTQAQWSRENSIDPKQLSYWVRKFRKEDTVIKKNKDTKFIQANIITNTVPNRTNITVKIGIAEIEISPGFNKGLLVEVIKALRTVS